MANLVLAELAKYGTVHVARAYGDWTGPGLGSWKEHLLENSIQPIQQFAYTTGKNATDAAMIIDAMDLLYTARFDGFCLVSSDSDFTRLASRIRESGLVVYGCGERKTPRPFVKACDKFIYVDNLAPSSNLVGLGLGLGSGLSSVAASTTTLDVNPVMFHQPDNRESAFQYLHAAVEATLEDDGWARLTSIGSLIVKRYPDFDARNYGFTKLSELVASDARFQIRIDRPGRGKVAVLFVRNKS